MRSLIGTLLPVVFLGCSNIETTDLRKRTKISQSVDPEEGLGIVGGKDVEEGWFASKRTVMIKATFSNGDRAFCSGSVLDMNTVLSAAHCFIDEILGGAESVVVYSEMLMRDERSDRNAVNAVINSAINATAISHEEFRFFEVQGKKRKYFDNDFSHDIAILKLEKPLEESFFRATPIMSLSDMEKVIKPGVFLKAAGFGLDENDQGGHLKSVQLKVGLSESSFYNLIAWGLTYSMSLETLYNQYDRDIINKILYRWYNELPLNEQQTSIYDAWNAEFIKIGNELWAAITNGAYIGHKDIVLIPIDQSEKGICSGDSGGPLFIQKNKFKRSEPLTAEETEVFAESSTFIVGITSFTFSFEGQCVGTMDLGNESLPNLGNFVIPGKYLDWIESVK